MKTQSAIIAVIVCLLTAIPNAVLANTIDKQIVIQPIQIVNSSGTQMTNPQGYLFEAEMDKIFEQAGIDIEYLPFNQFISDDFNYDLTDFLFQTDYYGNYSGPPLFFSNTGGKSPDPLTINMWFVDNIHDDYYGGSVLGVSNAGWPPSDPYGFLLPPENGIAISNIIFGNIPSYSGVMAFDVLAHELGHNLGLYHNDDPFGIFTGRYFETPENLMSTYWYPSYSIDNISPDGIGYNFLTESQIDLVRSSKFVRDYNPVPEPTTIMLLTSGIIGLAGFRRKLFKN